MKVSGVQNNIVFHRRKSHGFETTGE